MNLVGPPAGLSGAAPSSVSRGFPRRPPQRPGTQLLIPHPGWATSGKFLTLGKPQFLSAVMVRHLLNSQGFGGHRVDNVVAQQSAMQRKGGMFVSAPALLHKTGHMLDLQKTNKCCIGEEN